MPTCVIYYRVSTKGQEDKISLPAQKRALNELAIKNDWQVLKEYTEIASGKNIKDRPIIQELLDDIIDLKIDPDYVLVYEQDRLSRGNEFWQIKMLFQDRNIKIATIDKTIDTHIQAAIPEAMAEFNKQFTGLNESINQVVAMVQGGITMQQQYQQMQNFMTRVLDEVQAVRKELADVKRENEELKKRG